MPDASLSVVIVAHDSAAHLQLAVPPLLHELRPDDELIIVDNASTDHLEEQLRSIAPKARLVRLAKNVGFAGGANVGAVAAGRDLLVLLNPDAIVQPGWADAMREPWNGPWAAWMALVMLDDVHAVNSSGGVLHFTGFGWTGQMGEPLRAGPQRPKEVAFVSGACFAIPRVSWDEAGGFPEQFFMYCEDVDLSLRLRLRGERVAVVPAAVVAHSYHFIKNREKWRMLERNRWATVLRTYPGILLLLVSPALLLVEIVVWAAALRGGWWKMKALATADLLRWLPRLVRERRAIQASRAVDTTTFAAPMTARLSSPHFGRIGESRWVNTALAAYWRVVCFVLRPSASADASV